MKNFVLAIILTILSFQGHALEREIVVLTSIATPKTRPFWRSKNYEISKDIEKQFKKAFARSGYKFVIKHNTDRETLATYLQSPKTLALFWVSHAAQESSVNGLNLPSVIQDINGNNVKNIFQKINSNIKFLSLVGCNAKNILEDFKNRGFYHPGLEIFAFDKKIRLNKGINEALRASSLLLDHDPDSFRKWTAINPESIDMYREYIIGKSELFNTDLEPGHQNSSASAGIAFTMTNTNPDFSAELSINNIFIGVLKKDTLPQTFMIPHNLVAPKVKIKIEYDLASLKVSNYLEPLNIEFNDSSFTFDYLKDKEGRPYGRGTNFYYVYAN